jgi:hypothetical protein
MKLTFVHQVLIAGAIALSAIFGVRSIVVGTRDGNGLNVVLGIVSLGALVAFTLYLRRFRQKLAAQARKSG